MTINWTFDDRNGLIRVAGERNGVFHAAVGKPGKDPEAMRALLIKMVTDWFNERR